MTEKKTFLDSGVYSLKTPQQTQALYADWAQSYEDEVRSQGYVTPKRCADALALHCEDLAAPIHDIGCGTGLSGEALKEAGFNHIVGSDFSTEMLEFARAKPGLYHDLILSDAENPFPAKKGEYAHFAAIGVMSPGHAPASLITDVLELLDAGGCFVFSLNDHTLKDESYLKTVDTVIAEGIAREMFRDHADHLPGIGMKSTVIVLKKC